MSDILFARLARPWFSLQRQGINITIKVLIFIRPFSSNITYDNGNNYTIASSRSAEQRPFLLNIIHFRMQALGIELSVEVHPQPGPQTGSISVRIVNRMENYTPAMRHHVECNCIKITTLFSYAVKNTFNCQGIVQTRHGGESKWRK